MNVSNKIARQQERICENRRRGPWQHDGNWKAHRSDAGRDLHASRANSHTHTQQSHMDAKAASATAVALDNVPSPPPTRMCLLEPLWIGRSSAPRELSRYLRM